jgi:hypothetical protein
MYVCMQSVPGGKVSILGGHSIGHSKQNVCMYTTPSLTELFHVTARIKERHGHSDKQHAMSSNELQSASMLTKFSKMYYTR